jgi:predicted kinase
MATLFMICGMAGAGKTTLGKQLETKHDALRLCPDEWIKAVIRDETDKEELDRLRDPVETLQWATAQKLLRLSVNVILENGFWGRGERLHFGSEAKDLGAEVELHYLDVPEETLWDRLQKRNAKLTRDSFRVSREELREWMTWFTPPDANEVVFYDSFVRHTCRKPADGQEEKT